MGSSISGLEHLAILRARFENHPALEKRASHKLPAQGVSANFASCPSILMRGKSLKSQF